MNKDLSALEKKLSYSFKDRNLLIRALSHSSYANERKINKAGDYERLEFLGDAVVELVVSEFLFSNYPQKKEGEMTRTRAALVCEPTLAGCAREIDLPSFLLLGKGENATGGREKDSILCDVFEAVAGAIYLDGGYEKARDYISRYVLRDWENKALFVDSKSIRQERMQKYGRRVAYVTLKESGPANERIYEEELRIDGEACAKATGHSKKAAQQKAAYEYLKSHPE